MNFYHDSWQLRFREPFGAIPTASSLTLNVDAQDVLNVRLRLYHDLSPEAQVIPMTSDDGYHWTLTLNAPDYPGVLWYDFVFDSYEKTYYYGTKDDHLGGEGQITDNTPLPYQITVYEKTRTLPDWYASGIMYQIFPDRFAKGSTYQGRYFEHNVMHTDWYDQPHYFRNADDSIDYWDFFGGNIEGIIEKLDYLKSLHVSVIYLNPIFESRSNHKYDTADYHQISPEFGTEEDFITLCRLAQEKGIRIILDGVFSHTSDDSRYFNRYGHYDELGAFQSPESPYYDWYRFTDYPKKYECWWGIKNMPNTEEMTPGYLDYICRSDDSVLRHWTRAGASGWRLDVADELPDEFIREVKKTLLEEKDDVILIGEVWEDASRKIAYEKLRKYFLGDELDAVMNYPFRETFLDFFLGKIDSNTASRKMMALYEHYPEDAFRSGMNLIGSHDRTRILTILGNAPHLESDKEKEEYRLDDDRYALALKRLKMLALLQMTFPGVPCIYYGDEAGCQGFGDPYNRTTYPWGKEDLNLLNWYQKITGLRNNIETLKYGSWRPLTVHPDVFAFVRTHQNETLLCLFNRSHQKINLDLSEHLNMIQPQNILTNEAVDTPALSIDAFSSIVVQGNLKK